VPRPARRPLDPTELSWILELKILGKLPIRMFSSPESPVSQVTPFPKADKQNSEDIESEEREQRQSKK